MAALIDILAAGVIDINGDPLSDGSAYIYGVGTTVKVDVYSDSNLSVLISNPVTLDAAGRAEVYVESSVRVVIEDEDGNQVYDIDSIGVISALSGDVTIGNSSDDLLTINSQLAGDLIPYIDNTYDVGAALKRWAEGHFVDMTLYESLIVGVNQTDAGIIVDATSGDPFVKLRANGLDANAWKMFLDNSDSDKLIFAYNDLSKFFVNPANGNSVFLGSETSGEVSVSVNNQGAGDAVLSLVVNGSATNEWKIRLDNSDGDSLKFEYNGTERYRFFVGTNSDLIAIDSNDIPYTTPPTNNTLYPKSITKALLNFTTNGTGSPTINDGLNIASVTAAGVSMVVVLHTPFSNTHFVVSGSAANDWFLRTSNAGVGTISINAYDISTGAVVDLSADSGTKIGIQAVGQQ